MLVWRRKYNTIYRKRIAIFLSLSLGLPAMFVSFSFCFVGFGELMTKEVYFNVNSQTWHLDPAMFLELMPPRPKHHPLQTWVVQGSCFSSGGSLGLFLLPLWYHFDPVSFGCVYCRWFVHLPYLLIIFVFWVRVVVRVVQYGIRSCSEIQIRKNAIQSNSIEYLKNWIKWCGLVWYFFSYLFKIFLVIQNLKCLFDFSSFYMKPSHHKTSSYISPFL